MKLKYKLPIIIIAALIILTLVISTSYGIYNGINDNTTFYSYETSCLTVIYEHEFIEKELSISNDDYGKITDPFTISIENKCQEEQEVEIRLNNQSLDENENNIKLNISGNYELDSTLYKSLSNSASNKNETYNSSKILGVIKIASNDISRFNLRLWLDTNSSVAEQTFTGTIEVTSEKTFIKPIFKETIISSNNLFSTMDNEGVSYYYSGLVENNYVSFANQLWRIVRVNGDGTVRLVLDSELPASSFNTYSNKEMYLGYVYVNDEKNVSSIIKTQLDDWYKETLSGVEQYISEGNYCNDLTPIEKINQYGTDYYISSDRVNKNTPSLTCHKDEYNIGLLSVDEVMLSIDNSSTYLDNNIAFYTSSPSKYSYNVSYMYIMNIYGNIAELPVNYLLATKPVINIINEATVSGEGTINNPYTIDIIE